MLGPDCVRLAAMDEVGRGSLAGPVTIGIVVVTAKIGRVPQGLRDSKLLTAAAREALVTPIRRWVPEHAVGHASAAEIDAIGIMSALRRAAGRAFAQLSAPVDAILLDGKHNYLKPPPPLVLGSGPEAEQDGLFAPPIDPVRAQAALWSPIPDGLPVHLKIKADLTCAGVAGASVLAKTARDALMRRLDRHFPEYGFAGNKGYAAVEHRDALLRLGPTQIHRRSWSFLGNPATAVSMDSAAPCEGDDGTGPTAGADGEREQA